MKPALMGALRLQISQLRFDQTLEKPQLRHCCPSSTVVCGFRDGTRKPLWRSRVLSTEAIQAVHSLKLAKSTPKLDHVFANRLARLLKADLLDTLAELRRQNELDLALKVFEFVRKELWYKPDVLLYSEMIQMLGKNKSIERAEELFSEFGKEGLKPDTRAFTEMIGAYLRVGMVEKAMEMYDAMKASGCAPDKFTFTVLIRNLEKAGKEELVAALEKECTEYLEYPKKFLEEVKQKHPKSRPLNLV